MPPNPPALMSEETSSAAKQFVSVQLSNSAANPPAESSPETKKRSSRSRIYREWEERFSFAVISV